MLEYSLDQVFLRMRGGQLEFLLVLERLTGARQRETLSFPTRNRIEAVRRAAKHLAYRGDIRDVSHVRFRVEEQGELKDEASLKRLFIHEFNDYAEDLWD